MSRTTPTAPPSSRKAGAPRLGVLVSGGGRSLENLIASHRAGRLSADVSIVICSNPRAGAIARCTRLGVPVEVIERSSFASTEAYSAAIFDVLRAHDVDLVVMAGFLKLLSIAPDFEGRVLNIHPALLPAHGGPGMFGDHVHRSVLESGATESGCTVHLADNEYDHGPVVLQMRCDVEPDDTVDSLAARVFELEKEALVRSIEMVLSRCATTQQDQS